MTMISRLGFKPTKQTLIKSNILTSTNEISVIIPVKDNQLGIDNFLVEFFNTHGNENFPKEIIIVDNNSKPEIQIRRTDFPISVKLFKCSKIGPASARNLGVKQSKAKWVLFTDSDCVPTRSFMTGYLKVQNGSVGYAGNIKSLGHDIISKYYEEQEILLPPKVYEKSNNIRPDYLITANCLVWRQAFDKVGGFNEKINIAAGEDIDLGFKLLNIGQLSYAFDSLVNHNFGDGLWKFRKRFKRYGKGNKIVGQLYKLDLEPKRFHPNNRTIINFVLAFLQHYWLKSGYMSEKASWTI